MHPIDDGWRVPDGFPEEHSQRQGELQIALIDLGIAIQALLGQLRKTTATTAHALECQRLAVGLAANQAEAKLTAIEEAYSAVSGDRRLVSRALIRCEAYDATAH